MELLPERCRNKSSKYPLQTAPPQKASSFGFICQESQGAESAASQTIAMWPLHDGAKTERTCCSKLSVRTPRCDDHTVFLFCCSYHHSSHLPRGNAISPLISHLFNSFQFSFLVFQRGLSFFLCFSASSLDSHFLKGKPSPKQRCYVLLVQRVVLLKARGLSPDSDGQLPG